MHDAPFPRLIALLLTGACRAGKNTYYPDRRRPARVLIGLCEDGGMDREDLWLAVYCAFAETGRAPDASALAAQFGAEASEVVAGLSELAHGRQLALGDRGVIVMAHRFSTVPLGFSVMGARTL
jgi:hypothetical protein